MQFINSIELAKENKLMIVNIIFLFLSEDPNLNILMAFGVFSFSLFHIHWFVQYKKKWFLIFIFILFQLNCCCFGISAYWCLDQEHLPKSTFFEKPINTIDSRSWWLFYLFELRERYINIQTVTIFLSPSFFISFSFYSTTLYTSGKKHSVDLLCAFNNLQKQIIIIYYSNLRVKFICSYSLNLIRCEYVCECAVGGLCWCWWWLRSNLIFIRFIHYSCCCRQLWHRCQMFEEKINLR